MEDVETCDYCGSVAEYIELEWVRFCDTYEEELAELYVCTNEECKEEFHIRNRRYRV